MKLKTARNARDFNEESKEFVINMLSGAKTLHKKNGCRDSKAISKYYDFDTYAEAKESGIEHTDCELCKDLTIEKENYKKQKGENK